ncbi:hypothetical protein BB561_001902 [Smittium simulii]|uniref:PWI domain-containing protein n=1 Tax=Smittium simulii TaxID=133385 RepID=A0A2T9YSP0_9FUNG|nr:hypothetical protein BB561_001902 [Smittium simulii]
MNGFSRPPPAEQDGSFGFSFQQISTHPPAAQNYNQQPQPTGFTQIPSQNIPTSLFPNSAQFSNQTPTRPTMNPLQTRPIFSPPAAPTSYIPINDNSTSIFVGSIPEGITDEWLQRLLQTCGEIKSWKRLRDPSGKPKGFGFCEFTSLEATWRVLKILTKGENQGLEIPSLSVPNQKKRLLIKVDEKTRSLLDQYEKLKHFDQRDMDINNAATAQVQSLLQELYDSIARHQNPNIAANQNINFASNSSNNVSAPDLKSSSSEYHKNTHKVTKDVAYNHHNKTTQNPPSISHISPNKIDELKEEIKRESRYEEQQLEIKKQLERLANEELDRSENFIKDKEYMATRLSNWDEKVHEREQTMEYYKNRERWWNRRKIIRDREAEADDIDRKLELKQLQDLKNNQIHNVTENNTSLDTSTNTTNNHSQNALNPTESSKNINNNGSLSNISTMSPQSTPNVPNSNQNNLIEKKAKIESFDSEIPTNNTSTLSEPKNQSSSTASQNRKLAAQELVKRIPVDPLELFKWNIHWEFLDSKLLSEKIKPVVLKRLAEYLGQDNNGDDTELIELANYITTHLENHNSPESLVSELEMLLDEDASIFVARLWRILVFETEVSAL